MPEDKSDRILEGIRDLGERLGRVESAIASLSERNTALESTVTRVETKLNAMARRLLSPAELMALNIPDPSGGLGAAAPMQRTAAKAR